MKTWSMTVGNDRYDIEVSPWAGPVILLDAIIFVPMLIFMNYTLYSIYSALTIVEDENPPAYDPIPPTDDTPVKIDTIPAGHTRTRAITSSLRSINRVLTSHGGFKANFRGFFCALATSLMIECIAGFFWPVRHTVGKLIASLALIQFSAAWVHIVISPPSPRAFWRRLPPFKATLKAAWRPVVMAWAAERLLDQLPRILARGIEFDMPEFDWRTGTTHNTRIAARAIREADKSYLLIGLSLTLLVLVMYFTLVLPSQVILTRVFASLLPVEEDTIIPFDRSFQGKVEPEVVGGRGYATVSDAWTTFTKAGWRRLLVLNLKAFFISLASAALFWAVVIPEMMLLVKVVDKQPASGPSAPRGWW